MALSGALQSDDAGAIPFPRGLDVLIQALHAPSAQGAVEPPVKSWVFHLLSIGQEAPGNCRPSCTRRPVGVGVAFTHFSI